MASALLQEDQQQQQPFKSGYVPKSVDRHLQCIQFNEAGRMLLSSSSMTTRYWTGSMWLFDKGEDAPDVEKCFTGVDLDSGTSAGALFLDDKSILVGLDDGSVESFKLSREEENDPPFDFLDRIGANKEHNDLISDIALTKDKKTLFSCSYDKSIIAHDVDTLTPKHELINAHMDIIYSVDTLSDSDHGFVTASQDGMVNVWDVRSKEVQPCQIVNANKAFDGHPTAVRAFKADFVFAASCNGRVALYDLRKTEAPIFKQKVCDNDKEEQVNKMTFSIRSPEMLAICGDSRWVKVYRKEADDSGIKLCYEDNRHEDFVRGLAWDSSNTLWSCGWDTKVLKHAVN